MALSTEAQTNLNSILAALDEQMQNGENDAFQAALKYYTVLSCFGTGGGGGGGSIDISTLAKEVTATEIKNKLPDLSDGNIPVSQSEKILTLDKRILTGNTVIPEGSVYIYLKVILGEVTVDGLTYSTNEFVNYECCYPYKYPEINIEIPSGKSVRLDRGH